MSLLISLEGSSQFFRQFLTFKADVRPTLYSNQLESDTINPIKFALGNISMVFDMLFAFQHYVLYNDARKSDKIYGNSNLVDQEYRKIASDSDSGLYTSGPLNRTYD